MIWSSLIGKLFEMNSRTQKRFYFLHILFVFPHLNIRTSKWFPNRRIIKDAQIILFMFQKSKSRPTLSSFIPIQVSITFLGLHIVMKSFRRHWKPHRWHWKSREKSSKYLLKYHVTRKSIFSLWSLSVLLRKSEVKRIFHSRIISARLSAGTMDS